MKLLSVLILFSAVSIHAHNNLFFPSDAYFSSSVTKEFPTSISDTNSIQLSYVRYSEMFMFCGYAGCRNAKIVHVPDETIKNLESTIPQLFEVKPRKFWHFRKNPTPPESLPILIYNKDFDFEEFPVGLKFNEFFKEEQINLAKKHHAIDDRPTLNSIREYDTLHAAKIRPLDVDYIPEDLSDFMEVENPIVVNGSNVVFVILLNSQSQDLEDHILKTSGREIVIIGDKIRKIKYD